MQGGHNSPTLVPGHAGSKPHRDIVLMSKLCFSQEGTDAVEFRTFGGKKSAGVSLL